MKTLKNKRVFLLLAITFIFTLSVNNLYAQDDFETTDEESQIDYDEASPSRETQGLNEETEEVDSEDFSDSDSSEDF